MNSPLTMVEEFQVELLLTRRSKYSTCLSQTKEVTLAEDIQVEVIPEEDTPAEVILAFTRMQGTLDITLEST
jgi:hypothetical protein